MKAIRIPARESLTSRTRSCPATSLGLLALCMMAASVGCETTSQSRGGKPTGFLGDYSMLRPGHGEEAQLVYLKPGADWAAYSRILLEPVTLWRSEDSTIDDVPREEQQMLADYLFHSTQTELNGDYQFVEEAGPGVLRIRVAITEARQSRVLPDIVSTVVPQLRLLSIGKKLATGTHAFVGRAGIEGELLDSMTGERLGAVVDSRAGNKVFRGVTGSWSDVKEACDAWAKRLKDRMAELRGPPVGLLREE